MVRTQQFKRTYHWHAAAHLLNTARGLRQERKFQQGAAEHAVRQRELELLYYGSECDEGRQAQVLIKLQCRRQELDEAIQRAHRADEDFGVVRDMIQRAGRSVAIPFETSPAHFPLEYGDDDDDSDSGSSYWGV